MDASRISSTAWSSLTAALNTAITPLLLRSSTHPNIHKSMQTLDLASETNNPLFSGVKLGIVFTSHAAKPELKRGDRSGSGGQREDQEREEGVSLPNGHGKGNGGEEACLREALRNVGERRMMEGVMEFETGRVSFLVYRVD